MYGLTDIIEVAASFSSSYALSASGDLWSWGDNYYGELGLGDTGDRLVPTQVTAPFGYKFAYIDSDAMGQHVTAILVPAPEPASLSILAIGTAALLARRRKAA